MNSPCTGALNPGLAAGPGAQLDDSARRLGIDLGGQRGGEGGTARHHRTQPTRPAQPVEKESELIAVAQTAEHLMDHVWSKLTLPVATGAAADKAAGVWSRAG